MKGYLRGHWGCGCDMAQCDIEEYEVERSEEAGPIGRVMRCHTHNLVAYAVIGVSCGTMEGAEMEAVRRLNLMHEEDCR